MIIYRDDKAFIYASGPIRVASVPGAKPLPQPKRLSSSTLYPGGEIPFDKQEGE